MIGLFLLAFLVSQVWALFHPERVVDGTDAPQYQLIARNLLAGYGFSMEEREPYWPTRYREPGYPLFVAGIYKLSNGSDDWVAGIQSALLGVVAVLTYFIARRVADWRTAVPAGMFAALAPDLPELARQVLSETLFTALLLGTVLTTLLARESRKPHWYALAGALLGMSASVRAQMVPFALLLLGLWLLGDRHTWRSTLPRLALLAACAATLVTPWLVRNSAVFGSPSFTSRYGVNLIRRAPKAAYPAEFLAPWVRSAAWMATYPLSELMVPFSSLQYGRAYYEHEVWDFHVNDGVRLLQRYDPLCRMAPDWDVCATEISWAFFREHALPFVAQSAFELVKLNFKPLPGMTSAIRNLFTWLFLGALVVLWRSDRLHGGVGWLVATVAAFNAILLPFDTQERYVVPILPLYGVVAACGLAPVATRARAKALAWGRRLAHSGAGVA